MSRTTPPDSPTPTPQRKLSAFPSKTASSGVARGSMRMGRLESISVSAGNFTAANPPNLQDAYFGLRELPIPTLQIIASP